VVRIVARRYSPNQSAITVGSKIGLSSSDDADAMCEAVEEMDLGCESTRFSPRRAGNASPVQARPPASEPLTQSDRELSSI
jgi:hypothetical protein